MLTRIVEEVGHRRVVGYIHIQRRWRKTREEGILDAEYRLCDPDNSEGIIRDSRDIELFERVLGDAERNMWRQVAQQIMGCMVALYLLVGKVWGGP